MTKTSWNSMMVERAFRETGARVRRIDWLRINVNGLVWFECRSPFTETRAIETCKDKSRTRRALEEAGVATPPGATATSETVALVAEEVGYPVCIKPRVGSRGRAVTTSIQRSNTDLLYWAAEQAKGDVNVERSIFGQHYRTLVMDRTISVVESRPWRPTGDGSSTINELIDRENERRASIPKAWQIRRGDATLRVLYEQGLTLYDVLPEGVQCDLAWSMNIRQGAVPIERLGESPIGETVERVAVASEAALAAVKGLHHASIDLVDDGATSWVVDVNSNPGLGAHIHPHEGEPQRIMKAIVAHNRM